MDGEVMGSRPLSLCNLAVEKMSNQTGKSVEMRLDIKFST